MGRTWILDTETKGTGAEMVPLDKALERKRGKEPREERLSVIRRRDPTSAPSAPPEPAPRKPREFKVVDVVSRRVLVEGADARRTTDLLGGVRSIVDVLIYVREPGSGGWRPLTLREKRLLWQLRER